MDRYTKTILTGILLVLISIAVKDVDLFPIAEAQQGWEIDNELAMMDGSMQALPESMDYAYICQSRLVPVTGNYGDHGYLVVTFYAAPQCMGGMVGWARMYSDGALTSPVDHPSLDSKYLLSENQMLYYADAAARAADTGQRVRYYRCSSDKTNCIKYISFRGDPADVDDAD